MSIVTCKISDGTTEVSFLSGEDGLYVKSWRPSIVQLKGGGTWQSSPLSDGRSLVNRRYDNAVETFELMVSTKATPDQLIQSTQDLRRLLEKAVSFWTTDWQKTPVYIEVQAKCETNPRYAIIKAWQTPDEDGPFGQPFHNVLGHAMTDFTLILERGHWLSDEPGTGQCLGVSGELGSRFGGVLALSPLVTADDAYVRNNTNDIVLGDGGVTEVLLGTGGGVQTYDAGFRFRNVEVPQGAVIRNAWVRFQAEGADAAGVDVDIACEDVGNSDIFSTYANFTARARTAASVNWVPGAWIASNYYDSPSIINPVQDVIDRADWQSGNNLTVFFDDNASASIRQAGSVDTEPVDRKAYLYLSYEEGSVYPDGVPRGKGPSCANDIFVGNKQTIAQLTHIYRYDGAALMVGNMIGETDFDFFPAVPAVNDVIYFGIDNTADPGPFCCLVFNIGAEQDGNLTIVWEYWNGAAWVAIANTVDNTASAQPFDTAGVNTVHWDIVSAWATNAVNGVTGYWVRARITVAAAVTNVTHQTDQIYTIIWGSYQVDDADVGGDIPATVNAKLENVSGGTTSPLDFWSRRVMMGLRSDVRGTPFTAYLNLADRGNPAGFTVDVTGDPNTSIVTRNWAPTGRAVFYNPAGVSAIATRVGLEFSSALALYYSGVFRAFMRVYQASGAAGDFTVQLEIDGGITWTTDVLSPVAGQEFEVLDFGRVELPGMPDMAIGEIVDIIYVDINIGVDPAGAVGDLYLYDLTFMPVDEWSGEFLYNVTGTQSILGSGRYLSVDSIISPRSLIRAHLADANNNDVFAPWRIVTSGEIIHQANADQKMWAFSMMTSTVGDTWVARPETAHALDVDMNQRYFSGRGER